MHYTYIHNVQVNHAVLVHYCYTSMSQTRVCRIDTYCICDMLRNMGRLDWLCVTNYS